MVFQAFRLLWWDLLHSDRKTTPSVHNYPFRVISFHAQPEIYYDILRWLNKSNIALFVRHREKNRNIEKTAHYLHHRHLQPGHWALTVHTLRACLLNKKVFDTVFQNFFRLVGYNPWSAVQRGYTISVQDRYTQSGAIHILGTTRKQNRGKCGRRAYWMHLSAKTSALSGLHPYPYMHACIPG